MKKLLLFAFAVFAFAACTQSDVEELSANRADVPETLTVGFEGADDDTRIQLNEAQKTVWTKDDLVSVFYRSNANQKWQYQGETGERVGVLKRLESGVATRDLDDVVVVYPYNENYYINPNSCSVQAMLPATQHYKQNSYGYDGNIMVSCEEYNQISLRNVCGWLKIQLTGNGERVQRITLRGNNGEQVAGEVYINAYNATSVLASDMGSLPEDDEIGAGGAGGGLQFDDTIFTELTLDCGEGVELGAEAKSFYIGLLPQTFEKGFTVDVECDNGTSTTKSTSEPITIERNHIKPMDIVEFESEVRPDVYFEAKTLNGEYYGDAYTNGKSYNYYIILSENGTTSYSDLYLDTYYRFDIYSDTPPSEPLTLPVGVYEFDDYDLSTPGTFGSGYSFRFQTFEDGTFKENRVLDGKIVVTENHIEALVKYDDGKVHKITYDGSLELSYLQITVEPPFSRLTNDYTFNHTAGVMRMYYFGDEYGVGNANWIVDVMNATDNATMRGDYFRVNLVTNGVDFLEDSVYGTYTAATEENVAPGNFIAGSLSATTMGFEYHYSWYYIIEEGGYISQNYGAPLTTGTVKIEKDGSNYVMTVDCVDDNGYSIKGTYSCGDIEIYDFSE